MNHLLHFPAFPVSRHYVCSTVMRCGSADRERAQTARYLCISFAILDAEVSSAIMGTSIPSNLPVCLARDIQSTQPSLKRTGRPVSSSLETPLIRNESQKQHPPTKQPGPLVVVQRKELVKQKLQKPRLHEMWSADPFVCGKPANLNRVRDKSNLHYGSHGVGGVLIRDEPLEVAGVSSFAFGKSSSWTSIRYTLYETWTDTNSASV